MALPPPQCGMSENPCFFTTMHEQQSIVDLTNEVAKALKQKPLEVHHFI
jgi:hypothetical protein